VSISNKKGGTGKTTTAVNFAAALALRGSRVLLVDWDPQGNAATSLGVRGDRGLFSITGTSVAGLDVMLGGDELASYEEESIKSGAGFDTLARKLFHVKHQYIVIDCAPSLGWLTVNALYASTHVIVPMQCEFLSLEGLSKLTGMIELLSLKGHKCSMRIVFTMHEGRSRLARAVEQDVQEYFGDRVYKTKIPRNVKLAEAPSYGIPGVLYSARSPGALAYLSLAQEFVDT
jgi:chromosome partitioning protein